MDKAQLIKIALSSQSFIKLYEDSYGPDEAAKFIHGHSLTVGTGKYIPVIVAYYYYHRWAKDPVSMKVFTSSMSKYTKSEARSVRKLRVTYRAYKLDNFPEYGPEDELQARRLLDEQKEKSKQKKLRQAKKATRKKESSTKS